MDWEKTFANDMTVKRINLKYTSHTAQYPKKHPNNLIKNLTFFQRRHTNSQKAHENMLNITNYYRNADQN